MTTTWSPTASPRARSWRSACATSTPCASGGGMPVILTPLPAGQIDALLDRLDALCLSGGPDIHPAAYGAEPHTALGPTEPELDRFEIQLARRACARGIPVLGICRGAQVLNVALGGSLHQHLPDLGDEIDHRQTLNGGKTQHTVELEPGQPPGPPARARARSRSTPSTIRPPIGSVAGCASSGARPTARSRRSSARAAASCSASSGTPSGWWTGPSSCTCSRRSCGRHAASRSLRRPSRPPERVPAAGTAA